MITTERERFRQLVDEAKSLVLEAAQEATLFRYSERSPDEQARHADRIVDVIAPRLEQVANQIAVMIMTDTRAKLEGQPAKLTSEDLAEAQKVVTESFQLIQDAHPLK